jgi:hypothetical protein
MNEIKLTFAGDATLAENVRQAEAIQKAVNATYATFQKMGKGGDVDATVNAFKNLSAEAEKYNKTITELLAKEKLYSKEGKASAEELKKREQFRKEQDTAEKNRLQQEKLNLEKLKATMKAYHEERQINLKREIEQNKQLKSTKKELTEAEIKERLERQKLATETKRAAQIQNDLILIEKNEIKTLDDLKQRVSALKRVRDSLDVSTEKGRKEFERLTKEINRHNNALKNADERAGFFQRNVGNYRSALSGLKTGWVGVTAAIGAGLAVLRGAINTVQKFVDMYNVQLLAETKLTTVLKQRTGATTAQINEILKLTSAQQQLGVIGDEVQIAGLQQLGTFVKQTDTIKTLAPALNNLLAQQNGLASSTGDATNIANLFGKVMEGNVGALTRVGISFSDAEKEILKYGTESERAATLAQVITNNVGNMNEALAQTDAGKIQQAKNIIGDFQEEIGAALLPILAKFYTLMVDLSVIAKRVAGVFQDLFNPVENLSIAQDRYNGFVDETNELVAKEKVNIEKLIKVAQNEKRTKEERLAAVKQINQISPEYLGNITLENIYTNEVVKSIDNYIGALEDKVKAQVASNILSDIMTEKLQSEILFYDQRLRLQELENNLLSEYDAAKRAFLEREIQLIKGVIMAGDLRQSQLDEELQKYQQILDDLGFEFQIKTRISDLDDETAEKQKSRDIYQEKVNQINIELLEKQLELKREYKTDEEKINEELLKFQQLKQLELLKFIDENNLTDKRTQDELKYIEISEQLKQIEIDKEKEALSEKLRLFDEYLQLKEIRLEKELLIMQQNGVAESEIEATKFIKKRELLNEQLEFLRQNNASELEVLQVENALIELEIQYKEFFDKINALSNENDNWLMDLLGLTPEEINDFKQGMAEVYKTLTDAYSMNLDANIKFYDEKIKLIENEISAEEKKVSELQKQLEKENELKDNYQKNDALRIESEIRASEKLQEAKRQQQAEALRLKEEEEAKLKAIQKRQIFVQFGLDNASAISSIIKYAMANPLNAVNPLAGAIQTALQIAFVTANFAKARASIKQLKKGEVDIKEGSGNKDDVPALLMKGESVVTTLGTRKMPNTLRALNKNASTKQLLQFVEKDLGVGALSSYIINVNSQPFELESQNKELSKQNKILSANNDLLQNLLHLQKNRPIVIPMKNGYKLITSNSEQTVKN